ncbi:winged helix-turn-helix domain-containing protein [Salmonella enterica subsp. enterica serovar Kentucky]
MENNSIKKRKSVSLVRELLLNEGPHSQASISRKTGLSPAMVNYVVKKLRNSAMSIFIGLMVVKVLFH